MTDLVRVLVPPTPKVVVITRQAIVQVSTRGIRGLPGDGTGLTAGPGLEIVGNEIRYDIESLSRG
jgi:hypothetical protein